MNTRIRTLCEDARQAIKIASRETSGTVAEEIISGANVVRVTIRKTKNQSVTAVFKDETASGNRKLIELILTRSTEHSDIQAVYKISD